MSIESIFEDCSTIQHIGINGRISVREAKQRYANRLNSGDSLNGFRFGLDELQDLINEARDLDAKSLRFWKGRRIAHDVCQDSSVSPNFYVEDLIVMPVLVNGDDMYADEGSGNWRVTDTGTDLILASSKPCPEWCNVVELAGGPYFVDRLDLKPVTRDNTNAPAVLHIDHYLGKGCNKPEPQTP